MAERVGFEPTVPVRIHRFSRPACSTTPAPLQSPDTSAPLLEENPQNLPTGLLQNPPLDRHPMVQPAVLDHIPNRSARPGLCIPCPKHQPGYAGQNHRPGAHGTWLQGDVNRTPFQTPRPQVRGCLPDGQHLGVGRGIVVLPGSVVPTPHHLIPPQNHRPHRHLTPRFRRLRLDQGQPHASFVYILQNNPDSDTYRGAFHILRERANIPTYPCSVNHFPDGTPPDWTGSFGFQALSGVGARRGHPPVPKPIVKKGTSISLSCSPP